MTNLLQFTISVQQAHHQSQCISQLMCEDHVLFVWVYLHVSLCGQQHFKMQASNWSRVSTFLLQNSLFIQPSQTKI